jgi:hypothetical protein
VIVKRSGIFLLALAAGLAGCSGKKDGDSPGPATAGKRMVTKNDLMQIGLAYHSYFESFQKGPLKAEDLSPLLENSKLIGQIKAGDYVVVWGQNIAKMARAPGGPSQSVLAYEKDAPTKGGLVCLGDGSVQHVSAEEFKKMTLPEPGK